MTKSKAGSWIGGTVAIALVMALAAYFLVIGPTMASAQDTREQAQAQVDQNAITKNKVAALKKQFENMAALQTELAGLQAQLPTTDDMANFRRQLDATAVAHTVTIVSISVNTAQPAISTAPAAPAPDPNAATTDPNAAAAPAPAAVVSAYAIPITLDVLGSYEDVLAFLQDLQVNTQRLFLVSSINASSPAPGEAAGGKPAIKAGDLDLTIGGSVFTLPPATPVAAPTTAADGTPLPPTPLQPANGRNPMLP